MDEKTITAAAEQATEVSLLPAYVVDELEQMDLGSIDQNGRQPFQITDDGLADWAVGKILEERAEYDRLTELGDQQIAAILEKLDAAKRRYENATAFLTTCLSEYFETVPHKKTKTTEKYRLLSGTLTLKKGGIKATTDEEKLVPWLRANGHGDLVKVEETAKWGELKKLLTFAGGVAMLDETGEIVEGVNVTEAPDVFKVEA